MLSVVLGPRVFKVVEFSFQGKRIAVNKVAQLTVDSDLFASANAEKNAIQIKAFLKDQKIRTGKTIFSLHHHDIVSRELILPLIPRKEAEAIVVNEIEEAPRFASNPYAYAYQMHEFSFDRKTKVIYYVFQRSLLDAAQRLLRLCGLTLIAFDICPLSLLNSLADQKKEYAVVYVDDKVSHLMICRGSECRASYFFNSGALDFSNATMQTTDDRSVWSSFSRDLNNLLSTFYNNEKSDQLKIFFAGSFPLADDFFSKMRSLTNHECAAFLFDEQSIFVPKATTALELARDHAFAIGAIFRIKGKRHYFNIFNIWDPQRTKAAIKKFWLKIIFMVGLSLAFSAFLIIPLLQQSQELNRLHRDLRDQTRTLEREIREVEQKRLALEDIKSKLLVQARLLNQIRLQSWRDLFLALDDYVSEDIWLQSVSHNRHRNLISIRGSALNLDSVAMMIDRLGSDPKFSDTRLVSVGESKDLDQSLYQFTVEFRFSENLPEG